MQKSNKSGKYKDTTLEEKCRIARRYDIANARLKILLIMHQSGLKPSDFGSALELSMPRTQTLEVVYVDKDSGCTWNGKGRTPNWLKGKNKDEYLIKK